MSGTAAEHRASVRFFRGVNKETRRAARLLPRRLLDLNIDREVCCSAETNNDDILSNE